MAKRELAVRNGENQQWEEAQKLLTKETVRKYICEKADDTDLFLFITFCKSRHLNPFLREVYLIKYSSKSPASIVTSKDAFFKRAERIFSYDGTKSGIIVRKGTLITYREGYCEFEGEKLIGGWAEVYRKDRKIPTRVEVSMTEYEGKKYNWQTKNYEVNKMWTDKPATMITKVAEVQALRKTFPNDFMGMYSPEEMETGTQALPATPIDLTKIKEGKETVIDIGGEVVKPEKKPKTPPKKEVKLSPTEKKIAELKEIIQQLPVDDLEEKANILRTLQITLEIDEKKKLENFTPKEAQAMTDLLRKQFPEKESPKEAPKKEVKPVLRKGEHLCTDCKKNILREGTKTYDYAMKWFKKPVCFQCGQERRKK